MFAESWVNLQVHSAVEGSGFFIGQMLALMLLVLLLMDRARYPNAWATCALATMSLLDGFHALSPVNQGFYWLRSLATRFRWEGDDRLSLWPITFCRRMP